MLLLDFLLRWGHVLFGITWIGLLYYFNFIQGEYFKEATDDAKADATAKLAPRALWWFRWGAMFTFLTGVYLLMSSYVSLNHGILIGALAGTFMFLNVWLIIWPNQKIVCGIVEGDKAAAGPKALLASRTNVLFSATMLMGMLNKHSNGSVDMFGTSHSDMGFMIAAILIILLELNAIFGKVGPMQTVKGVIHMSLLLMAVVFGILHFV